VIDKDDSGPILSYAAEFGLYYGGRATWLKLPTRQPLFSSIGATNLGKNLGLLGYRGGYQEMCLFFQVYGFLSRRFFIQN
jgi:hypothetical protein